MFILGVMAWFGMRAVPLFMVLLFFSMQMLTLPKQMLHEFYQKYVLSWDPFSYYVEGLRDLIYLHKDLSFNTPLCCNDSTHNIWCHFNINCGYNQKT